MSDNTTLAAQAIAESIAQTATHGRIDEETYQNVFSETFNRVVRLAARIAELEAERDNWKRIAMDVFRAIDAALSGEGTRVLQEDGTWKLGE